MQTTTNETKQKSAPQAAPDAVELLKSQHLEVEALFKQIDELGDRAVKTKESLYAQIREKVVLHTKLEEGIFYPAAKEADKDMVLESLEEHAGVKAMLRKLDRTDGDDETFDAKITVLKELIQHHVKEEEEELFPNCQKALGQEALAELGAKMQEKADKLASLH
jgi:hemerythrin-like domain-containing protein